ncbi:MAG: chloride channel protein [Pseudomonadota bacterium]
MTDKKHLTAGGIVEDQPLQVMFVMALLVGIIGGLGAWAFRMLIGLVHNVLFLGEFQFHYDANVFDSISPWGPGVILVPVVGALAVAFLVKTFAPEAKGHGVPEVMDAIHYNQGLIRPRVAVVKSIASAISIGSGGSVGREGPIIQIGSAFGSMIGQIIAMPARQRITLIAAGSGAGIAATFNAPLGGVVFAIELLLLSVSAGNILLVAVATVTATYIGRLLLGATPSFNIPPLQLPDFHVEQAWGLLLFLPLGAIMGLVCVIFIRGLYWAEDRFDEMPGNYYTRHALGMLCVGIMIYALLVFSGHYYVEGVGYSTIVAILEGVLSNPWFLALLLVLKLLATCLSLGSGASGGVFSPSLYMGAATGATFGYVAHALLPSLEIGIPAFAIAGMAAAIGGSTGAVLTGIVMISEMTRDYNSILPVILTVASAYATRKLIMRESVYTMKLLRRGHMVPEGLQSAISAAKRVQDAMMSDFDVIQKGEAHKPGRLALVVDDRQIIGVAPSLGELEAQDHLEALLPFIMVHEEMPFIEAVRRLTEAQAKAIVVTKHAETMELDDVTGILTESEIAALVGQEALLL